MLQFLAFADEAGAVEDHNQRAGGVQHGGSPVVAVGGYYFDDIGYNLPGATIDPAAFRPVTGFSDDQLRELIRRNAVIGGAI